MRRKSFWKLIPIFCLGWSSTSAGAQDKYHTENVVIAIMDGTSWDVTYGDPEHRFIPRLWNELRPQGTLYTHFYNDDVTITKAGHSTITTGAWQKMRNRGPRCTMPTIFDYMADEQGLTTEKAWVVFGKGPYAYDPTTSFPGYLDRYQPSAEIGIGESTLQNDREVFDKVVRAMETDQPRIIFANFGATDHLAHSGVWERHVKAIRAQDELLVKLWERIQADPHYRDKTTFFLTNDHGYHKDGIREGFAEHGDDCEGCRHIMLFVAGPDIKKGVVVDRVANQRDIAPTVGELLGFQTPLAHGEVLTDSLTRNLGLNRKEARTETARTAVETYQRAQRDVVRELADGVLRNRGGKLDSLESDSSTAMLLWGMLSAFDKTKDERYVNFVRAWADNSLRAKAQGGAYLGLILSELTYRLPLGEPRSNYLRVANEIAAAISPQLDAKNFGDRVDELALHAIFLASIGEAGREHRYWQLAKELIMDYVSARDLEAAERVIETVRELGSSPLAPGEDIIRKEGKVLPTTRPVESFDNSWALLAVSFVRSHGLSYKGEYFRDVPELRAEGILQTYLAVKDLSESGEVWPSALQSALNIAAITEMQRRVDLYQELENLDRFDVARLRPRSPELLPRLDEITREVERKVSVTNYNVDYGFPPYRAFDYTVDLLRLYVGQAATDLEKGAFMLALDSERRIPFEPFFKRPPASD